MGYSISTESFRYEGSCFGESTGDTGLLVVEDTFVSGNPDLPTKVWGDAVPQSLGQGFVFLGVGIAVPPIFLQEGDLVGQVSNA